MSKKNNCNKNNKFKSYSFDQRATVRPSFRV